MKFFLFFFGLFFSLSATLQGQINDRLEYIERYKDIAIREMDRAGIPASIKLAQGLLESGAGTSHLARSANNHFGIKCGNNWNGRKSYRKDDDFDETGKLIKSCFRVYRDAEDSYIAHSEFLRDPRKAHRYGFLFRLPGDDYKRWAIGLKRAGYATSATYDKKLIQIIERYELFKYDRMTPEDVLVVVDSETAEDSDFLIQGIFEINDVQVVLARDGETLIDIARRTDTSWDKLLEYNELMDDDPNVPLSEGEHVYIQKKRKNYRGNDIWHYVNEGETMYELAQKYGLRLYKFYQRNRMPPGSQPAPGERVQLRGKIRNDSERPKLLSEMKEEKAKEDPGEVTKPITVIPPKPQPIEWIEEDPFSEDLEMELPEPPIADNGTEVKDQPIPAPVVPAPVSQPPVSEEVYHIVQKGDTLYSLARRYGTQIELIKRLNQLDSNIISVNQKLRIR